MLAAHRRRALRRPRPPRPDARRHRPAGGRLRGDAREQRAAEPRLRAGPRSRPRRDRARRARRRRDGRAARRPHADLLVPVDLLRLPGLHLRGREHRERSQPLRRGAGPRATTWRWTAWPGSRTRESATPSATSTESGVPYRRPVRQVHAHLAAQLHAAGTARARPGGADEADPDPRPDRRQAHPLLRGLDRARHPAARHHHAGVRPRRARGAHASRVPAAAFTAAGSSTSRARGPSWIWRPARRSRKSRATPTSHLGRVRGSRIARATPRWWSASASASA